MDVREKVDHVEFDMELKEFNEITRQYGNGVQKVRMNRGRTPDYQIAGFRKLFNPQMIFNNLKCSEPDCRTRPSVNNYHFCGRFHLHCAQCVQNLPFCSVLLPDKRKCHQGFVQAEISLYTSLLEHVKFACPNLQFGCKVVGKPEYISKHFSICSDSSGSQYACRFSECRFDPRTFRSLVAHLIKFHHSIFLERSVTAVSLRIPWIKRKYSAEYMWIPAIVKIEKVYFLIGFKIQSGTLYQWLYYVDNERGENSLEEIDILSGFEIAEEGVTRIAEIPPERLDTPFHKILERGNCFAMKLEDFLEEYLMLDRQKQIHYFIFDLDVSLLRSFI